ncbi:MAG: cytochrome P450 [Myxococcales bacterium]|nr:cytochrome P450 [Myxococcales bacterium]
MAGDRRSTVPEGVGVTRAVLAADPHTALASLREREPVSWLADLGCWLVTRHDLCVEVMRDAETYTVDDPRFSTAQVVGPSMLSLDGAAHQRHRTPFLVAGRGQLLPFVDERVGQLLEQLVPRGSADLRARLAAPLAVDVMARALDLHDVDVAQLLGWYGAIEAGVDHVTAGGAVPGTAQAAFEALGAAVVRSVPTSGLLASVHAGGQLTVDEIVSNVAVLLFGGIVTAESTTATTLRFVLHDDRLLDALREDPGLVASAVEESMRMEPAAAVVDRYATRDGSLGGASIAAGDLVRVSLTAANRDPAIFADPDRFELGRPNAHQHLAFARGPHACLGAHLARREAAAVLAAVLQLPGLQPGRLQQVEGLVFRAPPAVEASWRVPGA